MPDYLSPVWSSVQTSVQETAPLTEITKQKKQVYDAMRAMDIIASRFQHHKDDFLVLAFVKMLKTQLMAKKSWFSSYFLSQAASTFLQSLTLHLAQLKQLKGEQNIDLRHERLCALVEAVDAFLFADGDTDLSDSTWQLTAKLCIKLLDQANKTLPAYDEISHSSAAPPVEASEEVVKSARHASSNTTSRTLNF